MRDAASGRLGRRVQRAWVGCDACAQVVERRRFGQRHAVGTEPPGRIDRDHADQPPVALAAVDEPRPVLGRLEELETLRSAGQAERLDLLVVLV